MSHNTRQCTLDLVTGEIRKINQKVYWKQLQNKWEHVKFPENVIYIGRQDVPMLSTYLDEDNMERVVLKKRKR